MPKSQFITPAFTPKKRLFGVLGNHPPVAQLAAKSQS
jgi:hypothetical protein